MRDILSTNHQIGNDDYPYLVKGSFECYALNQNESNFTFPVEVNGSFNCSVVSSEIIPGSICVMGMFFPFNSHFNNCTTDETQAKPNLVLKCKPTCNQYGQQCLTNDDCCPTSVDPQGITYPMYCSHFNKYGNPVKPHCCPKGYYWDDSEEKCKPYSSCYEPSNPNRSPCIYDYFTQFYFWLRYNACIPNGNFYQACCPANLIGNPFGDNDYHYWPISVSCQNNG